MKIIDKMGRGSLVLQLSSTMSPKAIHEYFRDKIYVWNKKVPTVGMISDYILAHREKEPELMGTDSYGIIVIEQDEPRIYHMKGNQVRTEVDRYIRAFGSANVEVFRVVPLDIKILIGHQGGKSTEQDD